MGKDWKAQMRDLLKLLEPEFSSIIKKKRRIAIHDDVQSVAAEMQVNPALL